MLSDEYVFRNMVFTQGIDTEFTVVVINNYEYETLVRYNNFTPSSHLELTVSPAVSDLSNTLTRMLIQPCEVASPAELRRINEEARAGR